MEEGSAIMRLGLKYLQQQIAEHIITSLVNLSADREILENLATDDKFLDLVLTLVTVCQFKPSPS